MEQAYSWLLQTIVALVWIPIFQVLKRKKGWAGLGLEWLVWIAVYGTAVVLALALKMAGLVDLSPAAIFLGQAPFATFLNQAVYMTWKGVLELLKSEKGQTQGQ